jgi:hypothetical protein
MLAGMAGDRMQAGGPDVVLIRLNNHKVKVAFIIYPYESLPN